jgi:hypothetical protein
MYLHTRYRPLFGDLGGLSDTPRERGKILLHKKFSGRIGMSSLEQPLGHRAHDILASYNHSEAWAEVVN